MLADAIKKIAQPGYFPDGTLFQAVSCLALQTLAESRGMDARSVEIAALEAGILPQRYARNMKTISLQEQALLLKTHVAVIGLGGLGGTVIEALARTGIGTLTLVDGDRFEESNFNRQLLATTGGIGTAKVHAAAKRVQGINPAVYVKAMETFLDETNGPDLLEGAALVVDCLDSMKTRFVLEQAACKKGIPMVSAAIAGISGHLTTIFPHDLGLAAVYGRDTPPENQGAEATLGCLSQTAILMGALQASEVFKVLLNRGLPLRNRLLVVDLEDNTMEVLALG
jgi:molybdopterin/thiamine biosynthesis adenylyltransferase